MSTLIRGVRILDPAGSRDFIGDVAWRDGYIVHCAPEPVPNHSGHSIDGTGLWLMPPVIDLCARFREPGATHKADMASESRAALAAGIGCVVLPPDTQPVVDNPAMVDRIRRIAAGAGPLRIELLGALTQQLEGRALAEMSALKRAGCVGVSQADRGLDDPLLARHALEYARGLGLTVHVWPQDERLANGGCAHEGPLATRLGLPSIPVAAEVAAVRRWISLVEDTGGRLHFQRLSSARGVELIASARARGLPVTADVAAHQLWLSDADIDGFDARAHLRPPLRSIPDRTALRAGLADGTLIAVCSDHQPHEADAKVNPFPLTEPGMTALETLLPLTLELALDGVLNPLSAVQRLTSGPAAVLGWPAPSLAAGARADLLLVDPAARWTLTEERLHSRGHNTPLLGRQMRSMVMGLWLVGRAVGAHA